MKGLIPPQPQQGKRDRFFQDYREPCGGEGLTVVGSLRAAEIAAVSKWNSHPWGQDRGFSVREPKLAIDYRLRDMNQDCHFVTITTGHCLCTRFLVYFTLCGNISVFKIWLAKVANTCLCNSSALLLHLGYKSSQQIRVVGSGYRMNVVHSYAMSIPSKVLKHFWYVYTKANSYIVESYRQKQKC